MGCQAVRLRRIFCQPGWFLGFPSAREAEQTSASISVRLRPVARRGQSLYAVRPCAIISVWTICENGMKIAQVAPLYESVPPKLYGGTERVVSYLTEELVEMGHEVTLFASGDSETAARLIPACPISLRLDSSCIDQLAHHYVMLEDVMERAEEFDIIHFHVDYLHFPLSRITGFPHVTTLHGRLDLPDLVPLYRKYREMPVVSICRAQRKPLCWANWVGNVYHGLPERLSPGDGSGKYLAFLGRICPEKRVHGELLSCAYRKCYPARMPLESATFKKPTEGAPTGG